MGEEYNRDMNEIIKQVWQEVPVRMEWREEVADAKWKEVDTRGEVQRSLQEPRVYEGKRRVGLSDVDTAQS